MFIIKLCYRQSITDAKNRSINIILKNQNRSKQYCMFYNKFGNWNNWI